MAWQMMPATPLQRGTPSSPVPSHYAERQGQPSLLQRNCGLPEENAYVFLAKVMGGHVDGVWKEGAGREWFAGLVSKYTQ